MHAPHWSERSFVKPNTLTNEEVHVWRFPLDFDPPAGMALLSQAEKQRLASIKRPLPARRYLSARFHLRSILASYLNADPAGLEFFTASNGKPHLNNHPLQFNLSHSQNLALLAIRSRHPVGVDVEKIRTLKYAGKIAKRMFSEKSEKPPSAASQQLLFFQRWTAMEARQKAMGRGIFDAPVAIDAIRCQHFLASDGFIAAVATESIHAAPAFRFFNCRREAYDAA
ncbi:4'-phosphopantetheinyl transferase family protein [Thiolapillus sp.]